MVENGSASPLFQNHNGGFKTRRTICFVPYWPTVAPFVTAHTYCASQDGPRNSGFLRTVPGSTKVFERCIAKREKQVLAGAIGIQKENQG